MSSLYILAISPLSGVLFANIISHLLNCLFVLLLVIFKLGHTLRFPVIMDLGGHYSTHYTKLRQLSKVPTRQG